MAKNTSEQVLPAAPSNVPNEQGPRLTKATPISLRDAGVTEGWLEKEIEKDPAILRLGDVEVVEHQRRQEKAGRLDLLLEDEAAEKRYEVELMLGPTDESHIIRTAGGPSSARGGRAAYCGRRWGF